MKESDQTPSSHTFTTCLKQNYYTPRLSARLPWAWIEVAVAPKLAHQAKPTKRVIGEDLAGAFEGEFGGGISPAGRPRLPIRLMVSLLYLKNSFNLSDEELVERWAGPNTGSRAGPLAETRCARRSRTPGR